MRSPATGFWSLPVAVHELGHVVAQTLDTSGPGQGASNPVRAMTLAGRSQRQREELFADFFATFSLGPAYPAMLIMTRLAAAESQPQVVFEADGTLTASHPSVEKRIQLVLHTLDLMDASAGTWRHPYRTQMQSLRLAWGQQTASVGIAVDLPQPSVTVLDALTRRYWTLAGTFDSARHPDTTNDAVKQFLRDGRPLPPAGTRIRDVVTEAWCLRLETGVADAVEKRALVLIQQIMERS